MMAVRCCRTRPSKPRDSLVALHSPPAIPTTAGAKKAARGIWRAVPNGNAANQDLLGNKPSGLGASFAVEILADGHCGMPMHVPLCSTFIHM